MSSERKSGRSFSRSFSLTRTNVVAEDSKRIVSKYFVENFVQARGILYRPAFTMSSNDIKFEVCVDSIASALAAADGGASRIELCSALSEGGLTPSVGTLKVLKSLSINIPIYCMLRPRSGNDFIFSDVELDAILADMEELRSHGADGFVFGALTKQRTVDVKSCQRVVQQAAGLPVTFHRAFDVTNPVLMHDTVECIRDLGFQRILSSGFKQTAAEGSENLALLVAKHHKDIIIMPGAGITVNNLDDVLTVTKCTEFHASAKTAAGEVEAKMECDVTIGRHDLDSYSTTDVKVVQQMISIACSRKTK